MSTLSSNSSYLQEVEVGAGLATLTFPLRCEEASKVPTGRIDFKSQSPNKENSLSITALREADFPKILDVLADIPCNTSPQDIAQPNADFLSQEGLIRVKETVADCGAKIEHCGHAKIDNDLRQKKKENERALVQYIDIPQSNQQTPLRWIHISKPNEATLESVSELYGIKYQDLRRCLTPSNPPYSYRYGKYLVNRFIELGLEENNQVKENSICAILGDSFLITISDTPSHACQRVRDEISRKDVDLHEIDSSNYLFCRLLGCSLHLNEEVAHQLQERCHQFARRESNRYPSKDLRTHINELFQAAVSLSRALDNFPEVLNSLSEAKNLFGANSPRDSLHRYEIIHNTMITRLTDAHQTLTMTRDAWKTSQDESQNSILLKIAVLSGFLAPLSAVTGFYGMNFPNNWTFSYEAISSSLAVSAVLSTILIVGLFSRNWLRNEPRKSNE
jgi:Mg2+ and Co2+ transporter CorA